MSRVYRYDEIAAFTHPTAETFTEELDFMRARLGTLCAEQHISGAFIYGSATYGAQNPRSDIDLLVSTPEITGATIAGVRDMTTEIGDRSGIPVDVSCFTEEDLQQAKHGYYKENILGWLGMLGKAFPQNIIGKNPVEITKPLQTDLIEDVDSMLRIDAHTLTMTYMKGRNPNPEGALEAALNYPHKAGREAVSALQMRGYVPEDSITSPSKEAVAGAVARTLGTDDPEIIPLYTELTDDFRWYTDFVDQVREEGIGREDYNAALASALNRDLPKAVELSRRVLAAYRQRLLVQ